MGGFTRPMMRDGGLVRPLSIGDIALKGLQRAAVSTDADNTYTVARLAGGLIVRSGALAGRTDTSATAALILAAYPEMDIGDSFAVLVTNQSTQTITLAGGVGVTASGNLALLTLTSRWLIFIKTAATTMDMIAA